MKLLRVLLFVLCGLFLMTGAGAEPLTSESQDTTAKELPMTPLSPPATRSPRDTLFEFLEKSRQAVAFIHKIEEEAKQQDGFFHTPEHIVQSEFAEELLEQAIRTLNLSDIPEAHRKRIGLERALMLKEILERVPLPDKAAVPDQHMLNDNGKVLERWEIPGTEIALVRGVKEQYVGEYLFSPETVRRIPGFFEQVHDLPVRDPAMQKQYNFYDYYTSTPGHLLPPKWSFWLPQWSKGALYWDQTLWEWFALIATLLILLGTSVRLIRWHLHRMHNEDHDLLDIAVPLVVGVLLWGGHYLIEDVLNITSGVFMVVSFVLKSLIFITGSWFTYIIINWMAEKVWERQDAGGRTIDASLLRTLLRLVSVIAAATVIYFGAQSLGVPIEPLLAGFGAMGIAIGLGAQEYFKNVVGGLTLFLDRPVRVGEECEFGNISGKVEEIGLRSTRIRTTSENTLVIVPNSYFSAVNITNLTQRPSRVMKVSIGLRYDTTRSQLQVVLDNLRQYLSETGWIEKYRVRFVALGDCSLNIVTKANVLAKDKATFLEYQEIFLLKAMEIVEAAGTDFAFPSQTVYLENVGKA